MPRTKVFNKRKRVFCGDLSQKKSNVNLDCDNVSVSGSENSSSPEPSCFDDRPRPSPEIDIDRPTETSSSKKKLSSNFPEYRRLSSESDVNDCYDIVNLQKLGELIEDIAVCVKCGGSLGVHTSDRSGLSVNISIKCNRPKCGFEVSRKNSEKVIDNKIDINLRTMYAFRCIGKGEAAAKTFCGLMNLPSPSSFKRYKNVVHAAAKRVCEDSMITAAEQCVAANGNSRDITAIFDGSWQRRGHSSLNGVVTAISPDVGKVLDVRIFSKHCRCPNRLVNEHSSTCTANYQGSSGGMEVVGVLDMFRQSESTRNLRYKYYLGDGDSAAYPKVVSEKPYGPEYEIEKLECLGHVKKRMGSRLRKLKSVLGKNKLKDGKTIGGKNRLTGTAINKIQDYYGLSIIRNTDSLENMKKAVWATFFISLQLIKILIMNCAQKVRRVGANFKSR